MRIFCLTIVMISTSSAESLLGHQGDLQPTRFSARGYCFWKSSTEAEVAIATNERLFQMSQLDTPESLEREFLQKISFLGITEDKLAEIRKTLWNRNSLSFAEALTEIERVSIYAYTDNAYKIVNRALRNCGTELVDISSYIAIMNSGLDKLPDYEGQVVRKATLPKGVLLGYQPNLVIEEAAFLSTSIGSSFEMHAQHQLVIESHHGKLIAELGVYPMEKEVLFKSGTKFRVLAKTEIACDPEMNFSNGETCYRFHLEELQNRDF